MNNKVRWLRLALWVGIIADAYEAIVMLFPQIAGPDYTFGTSFGYTFARRDGAPLMIGWTALLLWADRKPVERRGVLFLTLIPVIGNLVKKALTGAAGYITPQQTLSACLLSLAYFSLIVFSLWNARDLKTGTRLAHE